MKLLGARQLSVLLAGTLLLCHGVFGAMHLICYSPLCVDGAEHTAEHQSAAGAVGDTREHSADHEASTEYFAVLVFGLLGLLLGLLLKRAPSRSRLDTRWSAVFRPLLAVSHPPPTPTQLTLQVFRL
jgi:phosphotransferase system  glucose/maltose/N-acetylglucosamine-specific IIC component